MRFVSWFRKWWGRSIGRRLLISNIIVVVVFLVLMAYLSFQIGRTVVKNEVNQRNDQLVTLIAQDLKEYFDNIWDNVLLFTYQLKPSTNMISLQARAMLEFRRISPLVYHALYLFDSEGHLLIHLADPLEDLLAVQDAREIINRTPILLTDDLLVAYKAARNGNMFLSHTYIIGPDQVPMVYMGIPIAVKGGRPEQIVVAEVDLRSIWRKIDKIRIGQTGRVFVISQEGIIIAHPDRAYIGQQLAPELKPVLTGYEGRTAYTDPISGARLLASYSPLGGQLGWGVVVEQEQIEALAPVNRIASITLGILVLAISMATIATILIARSITLPVQHLAEATQRITRTGNLGQKVTVEGQDEVSHLATMFNQMTASLQGAEKKLQKYSEYLEELVEERTSKLKEIQEQLIRKEKLAIIGQLAGSVGHELRNPLGVMGNSIYYLNMILKHPDEKVLKTLNILKSEIKRSDNMVSDLLDFSRVQSISLTKSNLNTLIRDTIKEIEIPERINFEMELDEKLPQMSLDPEKIQRVIQNMISNAIGAISEQGKLEIKTRRSDDFAEIIFHDSGEGILKENLDKIFEPLFTTRAKGIGLGLPIVNNIIDQHNGKIEVESKVGKGTTFIIKLPFIILKKEGGK